MRSGNLHLPILTRDNENQPLLIAVRKARTAKNKGPAMRPRLCTYAGITGFRSHAWLVPTSCLSSCEQAVCASASAPFSFSKPDFHFRCESRCLCYVASPPYEVRLMAGFASQLSPLWIINRSFVSKFWPILVFLWFARRS